MTPQDPPSRSSAGPPRAEALVPAGAVLSAAPDGATLCETSHPTYRRRCNLLTDHRGDHLTYFPSGRRLQWHNFRPGAYRPADP